MESASGACSKNRSNEGENRGVSRSCGCAPGCDNLGEDGVNLQELRKRKPKAPGLQFVELEVALVYIILDGVL